MVPVAGLALVGLAAAPIFPLLTLATAERTGAADATWAISLQVAASAGGNAALPAGLGLVIGALTASALGPALLVLSLLLAAAPVARPPYRRGGGTVSAPGVSVNEPR